MRRFSWNALMTYPFLVTQPELPLRQCREEKKSMGGMGPEL